MKIFFYFFLEGNKNCRVDTKKTGSVGFAEAPVIFRPKPLFCHATCAVINHQVPYFE